MLAELALRFVLGGAIVSAFALVGEVLKPKSFAGLFSAAPSVAVGALAIAFAQKGGAYAATEGRSMAIAAAGMLAYALLCRWIARERRVPIVVGSVAAWLAWAVVAFGLAWACGVWGRS